MSLISLTDYVKKFVGTIDTLRDRLKLVDVRLYTDGQIFTLAAANDNIAKTTQARVFKDDANGLIFDVVTRKPICIPPRRLHENVRTPDLANYTIKKTQDGTLVNFYYYAGTWHLSTTRAYDANKNVLMARPGNEPLNYAQIFHKLVTEKYPGLARINLTIDAESRLQCNLDTEYSHSFIFHYKDYHPIGEDGIWQVQSVNLTNGNINYAYFPELPQLETVDSITADTPYGVTLRAKPKIAAASASASASADASNADTSASVSPYVTATSDIIIRNEHMQFIKKVFYDFPQNLVEMKDGKPLIQYNHERYIFLMFRAFLTKDDRDKLVTLMDCGIFKEFGELLDLLIRALVQVGKSQPVDGKPKIKRCAELFITKINVADFMYKYSTYTSSILHDYVFNASNAYMFTKLYLEE